MMYRMIATSLLAGVLAVGPVLAEGPKPFPEFSAKRIKPPKAGGGRLITIQIDPAAQEAPATPVAPVAACCPRAD